jgi:uncharacterized protein (DUF2147 family)
MRTVTGVALWTAAMLFLGGSASARSNEVAGMWSSADADDAVIALRLCPEGLCGQVMRQPSSGAELELVSNFSRLSDTRWTGGRVYNLNDGATYAVDIEVLDPARLKVRACWLGFCEIQLWRRLR